VLYVGKWREFVRNARYEISNEMKGMSSMCVILFSDVCGTIPTKNVVLSIKITDRKDLGENFFSYFRACGYVCVCVRTMLYYVR